MSGVVRCALMARSGIVLGSVDTLDKCLGMQRIAAAQRVRGNSGNCAFDSGNVVVSGWLDLYAGDLPVVVWSLIQGHAHSAACFKPVAVNMKSPCMQCTGQF